MKVMIFARELLSVIITPFVLCFSLPRCSPAIIDFFREFTVHVDTLGYVCSFAVFDFKRHGNVNVRYYVFLDYSLGLLISALQVWGTNAS